MVNDALDVINFRDKYINHVNMGLMVFAGLMLIYLSLLFFSVPDMDIETNMVKKTMPAIASLELVKKSEKYYERILTRRKLFIVQSGISSGQKKDSAVKPDQVDLSFGQLQLLGIISGAQGPQAIISNITNDRSFYCYGNENVEGFIVDQVKSDRVILKRDNEIFELRL